MKIKDLPKIRPIKKTTNQQKRAYSADLNMETAGENIRGCLAFITY